MGIFGKSEEEKKKEAVESKIKASGGLFNAIDVDNYDKAILAQNECIIGLLSVIAINSGGMVGDAATLIHTGKYYDSISKLIK